MAVKAQKKILSRCGSHVSCTECTNFLNCMQTRNRKIDQQHIYQNSDGKSRKKAIRKHKKHSKKNSKFALFGLILIFVCIVFVVIVGFKTHASNAINTRSKLEESTAYAKDEFIASTAEISFKGKDIVAESFEESDTPETEEVVQEEDSETTTSNVATISAYGPSETYYYHVTDDEKIELAKLVWKEARGECFEGKVAVVATVLNRFYSDRSDFNRSSIHSIITQRGAFASIENVDIADIDDECYEAVDEALRGYDPTRIMFPDGGAYFFFNPMGDLNDKTRAEREEIQVLVIGNHWFHVELN